MTERTCPSVGGCASCPNPVWCTVLRIDCSITTAKQAAKQELKWLEDHGQRGVYDVEFTDLSEAMPAEFEWTAEAEKAADRALEAPHEGRSDLQVTRAALDAAVKAQPVVNAPPCPTCEGQGWHQPLFDRREACDLKVACPTCGGSGRDRLIPESEIRAWVKEERRATFSLDRLGRWLDERSADRRGVQ